MQFRPKTITDPAVIALFSTTTTAPGQPIDTEPAPGDVPPTAAADPWEYLAPPSFIYCAAAAEEGLFLDPTSRQAAIKDPDQTGIRAGEMIRTKPALGDRVRDCFMIARNNGDSNRFTLTWSFADSQRTRYALYQGLDANPGQRKGRPLPGDDISAAVTLEAGKQYSIFSLTPTGTLIGGAVFAFTLPRVAKSFDEAGMDLYYTLLCELPPAEFERCVDPNSCISAGVFLASDAQEVQAAKYLRHIGSISSPEMHILRGQLDALLPEHFIGGRIHVPFVVEIPLT